MLTATKMREIACVVEAVALHRLWMHRKPHSLITFEGTVLDRLCLHFVRQVWQEQDYTIVCSIRPCMDTRLQQEVRQFAEQHGHPFVGYEGDCEIDQPTKRFVTIRCNNISEVIRSYLQGRNGQLVLSGLLNGWSQSYFQAINAEAESFIATGNSFHVLNPGPKSEADWQTLFVFEGFYPIDVLAAYFCKVSLDLELHHIPTCYLSCHNEEQQKTMRDRLETLKQFAQF